jgi:hypothetical protein
LALVGFTGTLWWSTRALWQTSIEHSDHMKGSVEAARDAANASAAQADRWKSRTASAAKILFRRGALGLE